MLGEVSTLVPAVVARQLDTLDLPQISGHTPNQQLSEVEFLKKISRFRGKLYRSFQLLDLQRLLHSNL